MGEFGIATRVAQPEEQREAAPAALSSPPPAPAVAVPAPPAPVVEPPAATMVYRPEVPLTAGDGPPEEVVRERVTLTVDGRTIPVTTGTFVVGRSRECDVRVDDGNVSRRHFELVQDGPTTWVVADLGSTNGTEVNGKRVSGRKRLDDGDRITIGGTELVFGRSLR
jgi:pSer/pThr/pTyr-binding forkhead associated (FHA) protein